MAVFNLNYIKEQNEMNNESDILDELLEACSDMVEAIDEVYGDTYVKYQKEANKRNAKRMYAIGQYDLAKNYAYTANNNEYGMYKDTTPKYANGTWAKKCKAGNRQSADLRGVGRRSGDPDAFSHKNSEARGDKMMRRENDKLAEKQPESVLAKQEEKKKVIKETCLHILNILDELEKR